MYAVAARNKDRAEVFAKKYGIERAYGSYDELINDPEVDVVYNPVSWICDFFFGESMITEWKVCKLPNMLHFEWTMKALLASKHVLNEKPSADTAEETRQMFDLAEQKGLVLLDAYHYRYEISTLGSSERFDSYGIIGSILLFIESKRFWRARSWVLLRIFQ